MLEVAKRGPSLSLLVRVVAENGGEPALRLSHILLLATRVVLHLIAADFLHGEIVRVRVREVKTAHRAGW